MVWVGRDLWDHLVPTPLLNASREGTSTTLLGNWFKWLGVSAMTNTLTKQVPPLFHLSINLPCWSTCAINFQNLFSHAMEKCSFFVKSLFPLREEPEDLPRSDAWLVQEVKGRSQRPREVMDAPSLWTFEVSGQGLWALDGAVGVSVHCWRVGLDDL